MTDDDYLPPSSPQFVLSPGTAAGIAGLLIGCTLLISACVLMVFNVILFRGGMRGIPRDLATLGGGVGVLGVACLGLVGVVMGFRSWGAKKGESGALGGAATAAAGVGLIGWLIAGIDLMMILLD